MDSIDYYERYGDVYYENTVNLSMEEILDQFLALLPENAEVLDMGCGSGRDSIYMEDNGCFVTLMDGSERMCRLAEIHTGKEVLHMTFEEMDFEEVFDGIWGCASLLHVEEKDMDRIMGKVMKALKPGGILYLSFRYGETQGFLGQRYFHDYTQESAYEMLQRQKGLCPLQLWTTKDVRGGRKKNQEWVNILARKVDEKH